MSTISERLASALGGSYTIERELTGGGMALVFVAEDHELDRKVVIKILPPELAASVSAERFRREILTVARLQHPHIVPILKAGDLDGLPYFVMPYVDGESLDVTLRRRHTLGVREGLLHEMLDPDERRKDPLLAAASDLNLLRSRSPRHGEELIAWTDRFMVSSGLDETSEERRLRHAACLLGDIGWRAHPDYRGEQSLNIIAHGGFSGIDHPGRAYLALAVFFRHVGLVMDDELSPRLRELVSTRMLDRARVLGAALRLAYVVSAAMPGVLPKTKLAVERHRLALHLPNSYATLAGERVLNRLRSLARLIGREPVMLMG